MTIFKPSESRIAPNPLEKENEELKMRIAKLEKQVEANKQQKVNQSEIVKEVFEEAYENVVEENKKLRTLLMN